MPSGESYDVVIIGSGFGGAVTALRLAQAGRTVCVLERGKRYPKKSFPRTYDELIKTILGRRDDDLIDFRVYKDINVVIGSGVGGGSLIYANVHRPYSAGAVWLMIIPEVWGITGEGSLM